jgi:hypothetical protein
MCPQEEVSKAFSRCVFAVEALPAKTKQLIAWPAQQE